MTDVELVAAAKRGDQDAFGILVERHQSLVYSLACRMVGSPEDAADLSQEAFLRAWRGLPRFDARSAFTTWLYRLTSNVCIDFLRRERRRSEVSMTVENEDGEHQLDLPDERWSPEQLWEKQETRATLERGLAALSPEHRQILLLREIEGLSYAEIARILDLEEGTVKSRLSRARLALRAYLKKTG